MSRIPACFRALGLSGRKALVAFVTAGDPEPAITVPLMHRLAQSGADIIELGVPFSDPMADGPVIQRASERALAQGVTMSRVLELVAEFRGRDTRTPIVLMGYLNPVEAMGYQRFARGAANAGADGVITVDLPPEEAVELAGELRASDIDPIFLLAPTSDSERIRRICALAGGFVYYVSLKGVTGAATLDVQSVAEKVSEIRKFTDLPVGVGFGIRDAASAAQIAAVSDAVVVGSALVGRIERYAGEADRILSEVPAALSEMRRAMDRSVST